MQAQFLRHRTFAKKMEEMQQEKTDEKIFDTIIIFLSFQQPLCFSFLNCIKGGKRGLSPIRFFYLRN